MSKWLEFDDAKYIENICSSSKVPFDRETYNFTSPDLKGYSVFKVYVNHIWVGSVQEAKDIILLFLLRKIANGVGG